MKILPMLATAAAPFDDEKFLFEVKWDGIRALTAIELGGVQVWGRGGVEYTSRYPELAVLRRLPASTVVDGELVVLHNGRAELPAILSRHQRCPLRHQRQLPVCYLLFDLLACRGRSLLRQPLVDRRALLADLVAKLGEPTMVFSQGIVERGREFFTQVVAQGHEGVMAKRLDSSYLPGKRSDAWRKIKPVELLPCVVIGYRTGGFGIHSLLLAAPREGVLRYVGQVSHGLNDQEAAALAARLTSWRCLHPVVACAHAACWIEPEHYCRVQCHGWTRNGLLRHAVFRGWIDDPFLDGSGVRRTLPRIARELP